LMKNAGSCRPNSLAATITNLADTVCVDWTAGSGAGGIASYDVGVQGPNTARIRGVFAVPQTSVADLDPNTEYFAFNVVISDQKTVGGSCTGCAVPACVALSALKVYTGFAGAFDLLATPAHGTNSNYVSWQGGDGIVPFPNGTCAGFDTAGFAINTSVVGRGSVARSRTKTQYPPGSPLTVHGLPRPGDLFGGWRGHARGNDPFLNVIVNEPLNIPATFDRAPASAAVVLSAADVPADQGGHVEVQWNRSPLDDPS